MARIEDLNLKDDVEFPPLDVETLSGLDPNRRRILTLARKLALRETATTFEAKEACLRRAARVFLVDDIESFAAKHLAEFLDEWD